MKEVTLAVIQAKSGKYLARVSETKSKTMRLTFYVGLRVSVDGCRVSAVADEIGYSHHGADRLLEKWRQMVEDGNVTAHLLASAYSKIPEKKRPVAEKREPTPTETNAESTVVKPKPRRVKKCLGFEITREDESRFRASIRSAILFMQDYGKGESVRTHGEYYAPGTNPETEGENGKWLAQDTAALYCGCSISRLTKAAQNGDVQRRVYKKRGKIYYYEYLITDLDKYIESHSVKVQK